MGNREMEGIHFGQMIQAELKAQERTVTWFAKAIHCDRTNVYKIFHNSHIDTELLIRISRVLGRNFLRDAADQLTACGLLSDPTATKPEP